MISARVERDALVGVGRLIRVDTGPWPHGGPPVGGERVMVARTEQEARVWLAVRRPSGWTLYVERVSL